MSERMSTTICVDTKVRLMGSWGETEFVPATMQYNISYNFETRRGHFEMFNLKNENIGRCEYYAEGGLWGNENHCLVDYDGIYSLCSTVLDWLSEIGVDVSRMVTA